MASPGFALEPGDVSFNRFYYFTGAFRSGVWLRPIFSALGAALSAASGFAGLSASALPYIATYFPIDLSTVPGLYAKATQILFSMVVGRSHEFAFIVAESLFGRRKHELLRRDEFFRWNELL
jgi:hypothetical protein